MAAAAVSRDGGRHMSVRQFTLRAVVIAAFICGARQVFDQSRAASTLSNGNYVKKRWQESISLKGIEPGAPVVSLQNLTDLRNASRPVAGPPEFWQDAIDTRRPLLDLLEGAGVQTDLDLVPWLPRWTEVTRLYGDEPVILGMDRCHEYRAAVPPANRSAGIAGQFNTGTNAMAQYFFQNLKMPDNPDNGFIANVPWHKHGWVQMRGKNFFRAPHNHSTVLPVVIVRDPYGWFQSMCESPYLMHWEHTAQHCPNLIDSDEHVSVPARLFLGKKMQFKRVWDSLVHVWSEWYGEYYDASFPRLMIRFEDILFHTPEVMDAIRRCAGGKWKNEHFKYMTASSKGGKRYFEDIKPQSSMLSAIIKYGRDDGRRVRNMTFHDLKFARKHLDQRLMDAFHYVHPDEI